MQIWPTQSSVSRNLSGFNLILCDDDENLIHAFLFPDQWRKFEETIKEGNDYMIPMYKFQFT
ncbi:hypothetical protein OROHE_014726 [Orobanche hederae]